MADRPLPLAIAVSALVRDGRILLIKRIKGSYAGLLGMPGGKIELNEHASDAAAREVLEESGIRSRAKRFAGIVSEHETEGGNVLNHFLLFLFELEPEGTEITEGAEGKAEWVGLAELEGMRDRIIPSDFEMISRLIGKGGGYYECVMEKSGGSYLLKRFERVG
jgi:ADP-ribose pyrophosphatase YjhB (NUDIX family)